MNHQFFVYILANTHRTTLYIGVTKNLQRRLFEHRNSGGGFTSKYNVSELVYFECHDTVESAITREKQMKSWSRKRKNVLIESANPDWLTIDVGGDFIASCKEIATSQLSCSSQ